MNNDTTGYVGFSDMGELAHKISHALEVCRVAQIRLESLRQQTPVELKPCGRTGINIGDLSNGRSEPVYMENIEHHGYPTAQIVDFTAWKAVITSS